MKSERLFFLAVIHAAGALLFTILGGAAQGAGLSRVYMKKATWHETMQASVFASFDKDGRRGTNGSGFQPVTFKLKKNSKPVRLEMSVHGLDRLYLAALGRSAECGTAHFLHGRLIDNEGNAVALQLDSPLLTGPVTAKKTQPAELEIDGATYRGFALSPGEVGFALNGKYSRLELSVYYKQQKGVPPYVAVDDRPIVTRALERRALMEELWDKVASDFRDRQSQVEMEQERRDGIWSDYAPAATGAPNEYYIERARERLELAHRTLEFVQKSGSRPELAAELKAFEQSFAFVATNRNVSAGRELFAAAVDLRRRIIFSHPALDFQQLLVAKRPPPTLSAPGDNYYGRHNGPGPGLVILEEWTKERPRETLLLQGKLPEGCAMHADVSFDGKRIVFAYADHTPPREQWQFYLHEINVDGTGLRQLTGTMRDRMDGSDGRMTVLTEDYDPCYLPDGGIAFISTRNQGGVRCHDGARYCPTYVLYRCDANGSNIRQISFNEASEWDPVVMHDGRLLWQRWDYINRPVIETLGLWSAWPDGTGASHYFGNYTQNPCRISQPRPIPGSSKVVATAAGHHTIHAGSLIIIDRDVAEDGLEAITRLTPEATFPESEDHPEVSFASPFPLSEDLFLAEFCPDPFPASMQQYPRQDAYGIYLVDTLGGRELIYRDPEISCFEPMPIRPRAAPPVLPTRLAQSEKGATGVFYLEDVYQSTQQIPRGSIHRLRVNEIIPQPAQRVPHSSRVKFEVLKRVVGTVPVDPSGAVAFEAPAGVPLQFQALDENGMAVMTMRTTTYLQPGEQVGCVGCHEPRNASPAPRPVATSDQPIRKLEPPVGPKYEGGLSFAKTVQPVLDRYCIECHGLKGKEGNLDLLGTMEASDAAIADAFHHLIPSTAYASLLRDGKLVKLAQYKQETWYSKPKDYFAHGGRLAQLLLQPHEGVVMDGVSRQRLIDWLDLNAQFYGTYSWNKEEWRQKNSAGEKVLRDYIRQGFGEDLARQPFAALVNVALPDESRILKAPLAVEAGGWGQVARGGWKNTNDPDYQKMRSLVHAAIEPLPYQDVAGTCGRDENCLCLSCWVRALKKEREEHLAAGGGDHRDP